MDETSWLQGLFQVFTPRRTCMHEAPDVIWTHIIADTGIALAYFTIPFVLVYIAKRRPDLVAPRTFRLFAAFIFACGTTHIFNVWAMWQPLYRLDGLMKVWTAAISLTTAVHVWRLTPEALRLPSADDLRRANSELATQVEERDRADAALRALNAELEQRVESRTSQLESANFQLREQIEQRQRVEDERAKLLEREHAARIEAEHANRVKDEFLAILSHELRTPLNAILGWTALVRERPDDRRHVTRGLEVIERNARAQAEIVGSLLDMSAILAGRLHVEAAAVSMREVVDTALETLQPQADARKVSLRRSIEVDDDHVRGDRVRLHQVITNLVGNAVKFTPPGGTVDVAVVATGDDSIAIRVRDTGKGIEPEFLPFVFDRFRQADSSTTRSHGGLGLGLAIARHLVEAHGGSIRAESGGIGRGATFVVTLPRASAVRDAVPASASTERLEGVRALVVDDHEDTLELVAAVLERAGASVTRAHAVSEAREALSHASFDIVVSDLGMPDESGHTIAREVRASPQHATIPTIALSALAREEDRLGALAAGFDIHVPKPVSPAELLRAIATTMTLRAAR